MNKKGHSRTLLTDQSLSEAQALLRQIADTLEEVCQGKTLTDACRDNHLNCKRVQQLLLSKSFSGIRTDQEPICMEDDPDFMPDGFCELYKKVFNIEDISVLPVPTDYKETVLTLMQMFSPRDQEVLRWRFGIETDSPALSYEKIGDKYGLTRIRIHQIVKTMLETLQRPENKIILLEGIQSRDTEQSSSEKPSDSH